MGTNATCVFDVDADKPAVLKEEWRELCARHLPIAPKDSIWRYSRASKSCDPEQGWKLHISATVLNAGRVLRTVAPLLTGRGVQFKAPSSLRELMRLNSGLHHGYSQVGKFITVYPRTNREFVSLARRLHKLTCGMAAPAVPFDLRFSPRSNVYYRYGAFKPVKMEQAGGARVHALRNPEGELVPDSRESVQAKPAWVDDPLIKRRPPSHVDPVESPLKTTFRVFRALTQRGKGGVYHAVDLSARPVRLCVLKEGRKDGELGWDGRDGRWRIKHEERVLSLLCSRGVEAPQVYSSFEVEGNYYLATEFIKGESLLTMLRRMRRRMTVVRALRCGIDLSGIISRIHSAGWVWRDCKPANIIVTKNGSLRPLDFEGACPIDSPDPEGWSTPAFTPPERRLGEGREQSGVGDDLYALGVVIYFLLTGRLPEATTPLPVEKLRRNVPSAVCRIVSELLHAEPQRRPCAQTVTRRLKEALSFVAPTPAKAPRLHSARSVGEGLTKMCRLRAANARINRAPIQYAPEGG